MKNSLLPLALFAAMAASCASTLSTQESSAMEKSAMDPATPDAAGQEMAMPMPGQQHKDLAKSVGSWEGTVTMDYPGVPPEPMACSEIISVFGPFWVTSEFSGDFMGMPYYGRSVLGYDQIKGKYVGTWIDSMSSYLAVMEGDYDKAQDALVMEWEAPDMTGQMAPHRSVSKHRGDRSTMTFYTNGEQTMVISMKRK